MEENSFSVVADVTTENSEAIKPVVVSLLGDAAIKAVAGGFHIEGALTGATAQDCNRHLLSAMRRVVKKTQLRASWTGHGVTERYFDYVLKSRVTES
jgi:hypothetical protein